MAEISGLSTPKSGRQSKINSALCTGIDTIDEEDSEAGAESEEEGAATGAEPADGSGALDAIPCGSAGECNGKKQCGSAAGRGLEAIVSALKRQLLNGKSKAGRSPTVADSMSVQERVSKFER